LSRIRRPCKWHLPSGSKPLRPSGPRKGPRIP